jgi:hypothetical protein
MEIMIIFIPSVTLALALMYAFTSPEKPAVTKHSIVIFLGCIAVGVFVTGLIGAGTPFLMAMSSCMGFIPALLLGTFIIALRSKKVLDFYGAFIAFVILLYISSMATAILETESRQSYCESLTDQLEMFKREHGAYPASLTDLGGGFQLKPLKALFRGDDSACGYQTTKSNEYKFVLETGELGVFFIFESQSRQWGH